MFLISFKELEWMENCIIFIYKLATLLSEKSSCPLQIILDHIPLKTTLWALDKVENIAKTKQILELAFFLS